ncbi:hypothetical protein DOTSEDRAFT_74580 [Dothistroma septosporum NZE10]|uniref:Uncharacterized protein n=1 Tax=Dothistroma septosporum (strain NZE10 / CBS 128990) TaxID=675120 RepID=N1PG59_DOTSN|nr:hypothetical protein DOTSEDRAFT_74580 [Dothistroma septosporum NZE10]
MSSRPISVVVTGANRGIGYAIVEFLMNNPPVTPLDVIATARQVPDSPFPDGGDTKISWHAVDISDKASISSFASGLKKSRPHGIDVLINNAGVNLDTHNPPGLDISRRTLETNYYGTMAMTEAILPLMQDTSTSAALKNRRIVTLSSAGSKAPSSTQKKALADCTSLDQISQIGDSYLSAVSKGQEEAEDWPKGLSYSVSKSMLNAAMMVLAKENPDLRISSCCPGWCSTDTGKQTGSPAKTPAEGAVIPLKLAFGDVGETSGKYWENPSVSDRGDGKVADWTK